MKGLIHSLTASGTGRTKIRHTSGRKFFELVRVLDQNAHEPSLPLIWINIVSL